MKDAIRVDFYLNDVLLSDEFLVVPGLSEEVIIGAATMQKWRIKINFEHEDLINFFGKNQPSCVYILYNIKKVIESIF